MPKTFARGPFIFCPFILTELEYLASPKLIMLTLWNTVN